MVNVAPPEPCRVPSGTDPAALADVDVDVEAHADVEDRADVEPRSGGELRPRGRTVRAVDVVCLGGLFAQSVWGVVATLLIPDLVGTHPVLLELFTASTPAMVAAGAFVRVGRAAWTAALLAPAIGWVPLDVLGWWAGRRFGHAAVDVVARGRPRTAELAARADGMTRRFGGWALVIVLWLPIPNQIVYAATGWAGMRLSTFLFWDILGSVARTAIIVALGYALGASAVDVATTISHYALACVLVLAALGAAWWLYLRRRATATPRP